MSLFMRRWSPALFVAGLLLSSPAAVQADLKFEPPPKAENLQVLSAPVDISYVNPNGNPRAKIVIPLATLKSLAETAKVNKSIKLPLGVADPSEPTTGFPHGGTIIAGLAISLAMVSMVYLVRRKPAQKWAVTGMAVALIAIGVTSYLWADVRIPGQPYKGPARRPDNVVRPIPNQQPMVTIEIAEKGDTILIVVPPVGQ
jgi:hypothetical protein